MCAFVVCACLEPCRHQPGSAAQASTLLGLKSVCVLLPCWPVVSVQVVLTQREETSQATQQQLTAQVGSLVI